MDFLLASLMLIVSLVILNYLLINYSKNNYHKYLNVDTNTKKIVSKSTNSDLTLDDKIHITYNGLIFKPILLIKSYLSALKTPISKKTNLLIDKISYTYTSLISKINTLNSGDTKITKKQVFNNQKIVDEKIKTDDNQFDDNIITQRESTKEEIFAEQEETKFNKFINYEKIEDELISRMDKESRDQKFMTALELGDIYGKMNNREEQKEMYLWVLENSNNKSKDMARDRIIAL